MIGLLTFAGAWVWFGYGDLVVRCWVVVWCCLGYIVGFRVLLLGLRSVLFSVVRYCWLLVLRVLVLVC